MTTLPRSFLDRPIAHRGYHDAALGRPENSRAAFEAAIEAGFGIELDVQMSSDGVPVVFHDPTLNRMTANKGPVRKHTAEELGGIALNGGTDVIEPLDAILEQIGDRAPVLVEIKDQTGGQGADIAALDQATGWVVRNAVEQHGLTAGVMSFNPKYIAALTWLGPGIPRGLVGMKFDVPGLGAEVNEALTRYSAFDDGQCSFVSHDRKSLDSEPVARMKAAGVTIFTWTVRSPEEEQVARQFADNITFEGYDPRANMG